MLAKKSDKSNQESKPSNSNKMRNPHVWKTLAIIFIILFAAVVIGGFLNARHFRPSSVQATSAQMDLAKSSAIADLQNRGENPANYSVKISDNIRNAPRPDEKNVLEISFYNESVRHMYIIDASTGNILVYSKTEFNDGLNHSKDMMSADPRGFFAP